MKNRDKFPAFRDLGKQILNQELQETMSNVFKHIDDRQGWHVTRGRTGEQSYKLFSSNSGVSKKERKSSKGELSII